LKTKFALIAKLLLAAIVAVFTITARAQNTDSSTAAGHDSEINLIAEKFLETSSSPGVVMSIAEVNRPLRIASAGLRKHGDPTEFSIEDKMHLGSCTKAMTATLVARLVEQNKLKFSSTIAEILPSLSDHIHKAYHDVTIEQLLSHQSGMPANPSDWWLDHGESVSKIRIKIAKTALLSEPEFRPGTSMLYSNLGYMIAGLMLEEVGGATWEELMTTELFLPMGLDSAGFGPPSIGGSVSQPWGHTVNFFGRLKPDQIDNAPPLGPAGRVHMNFSDWAKFIMAHASDGKSLADPQYLSAASWQKLHTPLRDDYGLGWAILSRSWAKGLTYTHSGSNTRWYSVVWVAPELNRAFMVGANVADRNTASEADAAIGDLISLQ